MAGEHDGVTIPITAENAELKHGLNESEHMIKEFGERVHHLLEIIGVIFVAEKAFEFGKEFIHAAAEAEVAGARLGAVIKATGGAAGLTKKEMEELAEEMKRKTRFDDDVVKSSEAVLATFREIKGDIFKEAIKSAADMAEVMGGDLQGSTMQLGKALNDPIEGMQALKRAGVSFTEAQKAQIKTLQESGDLLGAQKVILEEVRNEFGGAAEAIGKTFSGRMAQFKHSLEDTAKAIGKALIPALDAVMPHIESLAKWFEEVAAPVIGQAIQFIIDATGKLIEWLKPIGEYVWTTLSGVWQKIEPAWEDGISHLGEFIKRVGEFFMPLLGMIKPVWEALLSAFEEIYPVIIKVDEFIYDLVSSIGDFLQPIIEALINDGIMPLVDFWKNEWMPAASSVYDSVIDFAQGLLNVLKPAIAWLGEALGAVTSVLVGTFVEGLKTTIGFILDWGKTIIDFLKPVFGWLVDTAIECFTYIQVLIENWSDTCTMYITAFELAFVSAWETIKFWFTDVVPAYLQWFGRNWTKTFVDAGNFIKTICSNMYENLTGFFKATYSWMQGKGFDWKWKGLLDGFESTMEELPKVADRKKSDLEKELGHTLDSVQARMGTAFNDRLEKNRSAFFGAFHRDMDKINLPKLAGKEEGPEDSNVAGGNQAGKGEEKKGEKAKTSFEDLISLNKRIAAAAQGDDGNPVVKALNKHHEKQLNAAKEHKHVAEKANVVLEKHVAVSEQIKDRLEEMELGLV